MNQDLLIDIAVAFAGAFAGGMIFDMAVMNKVVKGQGKISTEDMVLVIAGPVGGSVLALRYGRGIPFGSRMVVPVVGAIGVNMLMSKI